MHEPLGNASIQASTDHKTLSEADQICIGESVSVEIDSTPAKKCAKSSLEPIRELMTHDERVTAVRLSMMRIMASFTNATAMRVWRS